MQNLLWTLGRVIIAELSLLEDGWREKERARIPFLIVGFNSTWSLHGLVPEPFLIERRSEPRYEARSYSCDLLRVRYHQPLLLVKGRQPKQISLMFL